MLYLGFKRLSDIIFSFLLLLIFFFPLLLLCVGKAIFQRDCPLFLQERLGRNKKTFLLLKIRTMDKEGKTCCFDRFLRRYSIDELPQLWNILVGEMSFVGFRPVIPKETELIELRWQKKVYDMRPGLTGWAQINGRDTLSPEAKANFDSFYRDHCSILFDLLILGKTIFCVVCHKDVSEKY